MTMDTFGRGDITLENWRVHPFSTYSFEHVSEFVPSARIKETSEIEPPSPGAKLLQELSLRDADGSPIGALAHMERSHTDHLVVMRDFQVISEWQAHGRRAENPHLIFSISKSVTGLLAGIAVSDGKLDPEAKVTRYVPSMGSSTYGSARVRDLLDMTVDVDFDEEYLNHGGAFDRYRRAMLWNPERDDTRPETMEAFLGTLGERGHGHGHTFYYASPNSDLLGLVVERAVGQRYHAYLRERLWLPMGAKGAAEVTVDRVGTARAAGGISVTTRDLARMGQLIMNGGRTLDGLQVVPDHWIRDLTDNGDRQAWVQGNFADMFEDGRYRSCWYQVGDADGCFAAVGIHGQWLWCNPATGIVLAKTSSRPAASDDVETNLESHILSQIAAAL